MRTFCHFTLTWASWSLVSAGAAGTKPLRIQRDDCNSVFYSHGHFHLSGTSLPNNLVFQLSALLSLPPGDVSLSKPEGKPAHLL